MHRLKGKTAMVVGAGSIGPGWGNGKATAVTFCAPGARQVFCVDRNGKAAQENRRYHCLRGWRGPLRSPLMPPRARRCRGDGRRLSQDPSAAIDVLDNNVGIAEMGNVVDVSEASWDHVFEVNLKKRVPLDETCDSDHGAAGRAARSSTSPRLHPSVISAFSYVSYATTKAAMNQMTRTTRGPVRAEAYPG